MEPELILVEIASAPLLGGEGLLMAGLWARDGEPELVELARLDVTVYPPKRQEREPLQIELAAVPMARELVEHGEAAWPHASFDSDGRTVLGCRDGLTLAAMRFEGAELVWLGWSDGSGGVILPMAELASLSRVLRETETGIAGLGHMVEGSDAVN